MGVNLISIFLERQTYIHFDYLTTTQHQGNSASIEFVQNFLADIHSAGIEQNQEVAVAAWVPGKELYRQELTSGFQDAFAISTIIIIATLTPTYFLGKYLKQTKLTADSEVCG